MSSLVTTCSQKEYELEVCANSPLSCKAAREGGAQRVELCASLPEGGTTPSYGAIKLSRKVVGDHIALHVIIRPRGGDFIYTEEEVNEMVADIEMCRHLGVDGVVFGCLTQEGDYDEYANSRLLEAAKGMSVTFHRAFDYSRNLYELMELLIARGFHRVLTSGGAPTAPQGAEMLRRLVIGANERIGIMCGGGITPTNLEALAQETGARMFHGTFKCERTSISHHKSPLLNVSDTHIIDAYNGLQSDKEAIACARRILNGL